MRRRRIVDEPNKSAELRPEVLEFAHVMEARLRANDEKRGHYGWRRETTSWLLGRLRAETEEFRQAVETGSVASVLHEAADVANFAMFVWDAMRERARTHALATSLRPQLFTHPARAEPPPLELASVFGACLTCGGAIQIASFVRRTAHATDGRTHVASFCGSWCAQEYERRLGVTVR